MDYNNLSDFEINKGVATEIGGFDKANFFEVHSVIFKSCGRFQYTCFDPCNNPTDAWEIITTNKIGLSPSGDIWHAYSPEENFLFSDVNPLRAAMIVFLKMQDSANVPANSTGSDLR